jgi:polyisoprenoid-binding protein YceI
MSTITADTVEIVPAGTWAVDPVHSSIGFEIAYLGGTFRGTFTDVDASLTGDKLTGSARVENVHVQDENLAGHLLGPDFFDAERFPVLTFESTTLSGGNGKLHVGGGITLKGVTKPVELEGTIAAPVTDPYGRERISVELETTIDRTAFGINWNADLPSGEPALSNDVRLVTQLFLVKEA